MYSLPNACTVISLCLPSSRPLLYRCSGSAAVSPCECLVYPFCLAYCMYEEVRLASGLVAACTANSLLNVVSVELRCRSWRACEADTSDGSSASFSTGRMRRRSMVARTSSSYLRSRLAGALSPEGRPTEADCGGGSSLASCALGGRTFSVGRCDCG